MTSKVDFSFLDRDIATQKETARYALEAAKEIDEQLAGMNANDPRRPSLEDSRKRFLDVAKRIANNANTTAAEAISTMSHFTRVSS